MSVFLILLGTTFRLLPHLPNFAPISALSLFSGRHLKRRDAFLVPLASMFFSDLFISRGYYGPTQIYVYVSFILIGFLGLYLRSHRSYPSILTARLAASLLFFLLTNFGVWASPSSWYPRTIQGLIECYIAAIPFFRNTLAGDLFYSGLLFGGFELANRLRGIKIYNLDKNYSK